ncbi:metal ABC transporter substrate-binding protein [Bdellovibrio svalbardensis]|uniref:Metal ABC transporter substrate-binding protein n=1 Tax=Bdellovibrio svalbardensis TaxID=2972972 RepID=A0ABT6DEX9_9BACT|nr:metal ABC transporter substrate-binding protein [Bdellovibrio svalbardensis]MDG0815382.1 metal ABC transporter substrate-binding protein [Bdellovibrio svalbardensis]
MKNIFLGLTLILSFMAFSTAQAKIKVVATLPDVAEVLHAIGGDEVEISTLLSGSEDPHYSDARPDYILKVRKADIVCAVGLDLEIGWLPKVLDKAGNAKVQSGGLGFCELGRSVKPLEIPSGVVDRSLGDVHPHGNPHFALDPLKLVEAGSEAVRVLTATAPEKAEIFRKNYDTFKNQMTTLHEVTQKKVKKDKVMEYHKEFTYFFASYGIQSMGSLEEKPGMPPSAARIAQIANLAKASKVTVLFATASAPHATLERFHELSGIPVVTVPSYIQTTGEAKTIEGLQNLLVRSLP